MSSLGKAVRASVASLFLAGGLATSAHAFGVLGPFGGELRQMTLVKGHVVCTNCSIEEVRKAQPDREGRLYQVNHNNGQLVMAVDWLNEEHRWRSIVGSASLFMRSSDILFEQLAAEENRFKDVQLTGLLKSTRTFHLFHLEPVESAGPVKSIVTVDQNSAS